MLNNILYVKAAYHNIPLVHIWIKLTLHQIRFIVDWATTTAYTGINRTVLVNTLAWTHKHNQKRSYSKQALGSILQRGRR